MGSNTFIIAFAVALGCLAAQVVAQPDCNSNGIDDACDIDCGPPGGPCDVPSCQLSSDADSNGVPDECQIRYVDTDAPPAGDGQSWATAYHHLQDAISDAINPANAVNQVWVANGTYMPDGGYTPAGGIHIAGSGDRKATFQLIDDVSIYGGFEGGDSINVPGGETDLSQRPSDPNPQTTDSLTDTILSGDLNANDGPDFANNAENSEHVTTGSGANATAILDGDNSYHVLFAESVGPSAVLDGFTITGGRADAPSGVDADGGGMHNRFSSPTLNNCTFIANQSNAGGGIYNNGSSPSITNCSFIDNASGLLTAGGGGMWNTSGSNPTLHNCTFTGNTSTNMAGGIGNFNSNPTLTECTFVGNTAADGGGTYNTNSSPILMQCTFTANMATGTGGATFDLLSNSTYTGCAFTSNQAGQGGALYSQSGDPVLVECSFLSNSATGNGGAAATSASGISFSRCLFSANTAGADGGGLRFADNSTPTLTDCTFNGNMALTGAGGGMFNTNSSPTLDSCTFIDNGANSGGGIYNTASSPEIRRCVFVGHAGSAVQLMDASNATISETRFIGNNGSHAIFSFSSSTALITNTIFAGQDMPSNGGTVTADNGSVLTLINCILAGNSTPDSFAALRQRGGTFNITNTTIVANSAGVVGGGLGHDSFGGTTTIVNSILWGNTANNGADTGAVAQMSVPFGSATLDYSTIQDGDAADAIVSLPAGTTGGNNLDLDPIFVGGPSGSWTNDATYDSVAGQTTLFDSGAALAVDELADRFLNPDSGQDLQSLIVSNTAMEIVVWGDFSDEGTNGTPYQINDYRLSLSSPAIESGDNATTGLIGISSDLDGNERIVGPVVDMGAYESQVRDCNGNGVDDMTDVSPGETQVSIDLNANGIPDECEADCNNNGVPDDLDIASGTSLAGCATFEALDFGGFTTINDMTPDGSVIVGYQGPSFSPSAIRWTRDSGPTTIIGGFFALAVADSGNVVVGDSGGGNGCRGAFYWSLSGGFVNLPDLPKGGIPGCSTCCKDFANAEVVSGDGVRTYGFGRNSGVNVVPARWTNFQVETYCSFIIDASSDGSIVLAKGQLLSGSSCNVLSTFSPLPGGGSLKATKMSPGGIRVVGQSESALGSEAFLWEAGVTSSLSDLPGGGIESMANTLSDDGQIVAGWGTTARGREAMIWDAVNGIRELKEILTKEYDIDLVGWNLSEVIRMSSNGMILAGHGTGPQGKTAWIVELTDCNTNGVPDHVDAARGIDCNSNGVPDQCEIDCDGNGIPDTCDLAKGIAFDCNLSGILDHCELDCNGNRLHDDCDIATGTSSDCNSNGIPDECDVANLASLVADLQQTDGAALFRTTGKEKYQSVIADYGRPWQPCDPLDPSCFPRTPDLADSDPASVLRALIELRVCPAFADVLQPAVHELFSFEMLLGNEAFSDALDPTVGGLLDDGGLIDPVVMGDLYAFEGPDVPTLLDEELALLRGRDLCPGGGCVQDDWLDDSIYYPEFTKVGELPFRAAIYNRLQPNSESTTEIAYQSNYEVTDDYDAVTEKFPQGHGDAYGYYLTAAKAYLNIFRGDGDPAAPSDLDEIALQLILGQDAENEMVIQDPDCGGICTSGVCIGGTIPDNDCTSDAECCEIPVSFKSVRNMAIAMSARARTAVRLTDLVYRRNYVEVANFTINGTPCSADASNCEILDPKLNDADTERAWGTLDWARRGALGAYLDWAVVNSLLPAADIGDGDDLGGPVRRQNVEQIEMLAGAVSQIQERVDAAGAGLNPLGLVQNVVPFGIDAGAQGFGTNTGLNHYEQVRAAACQALDNAATILLWANRSAQRLRENADDQMSFAKHVDDRESDFTNRFIELFGFAADNDPADNDLDLTTLPLGVEEANGPDLINFLLTDEGLAAQGFGVRKAPGEIQLALSELRIAELRGDQADLALQAHVADIDRQVQRIEFLTQTSIQEIDIIVEASHLNMALTDRLKQLKTSCGFWCKLKKGIRLFLSIEKAISSCVEEESSCFRNSLNALDNIATVVTTAQAYRDLKSEFDIQKERQRIEGWKQAELANIRNIERLDGEDLRLQSLIRQTPQLMVNIGIAGEIVVQSIGRLSAATQRGQRLFAERERVRKLKRDSLQDFRYKDMAFRIFRNNALQQYPATFDLAARYVFLAVRAYAYEYNDRTSADQLIEKIHHIRLLGSGDCDDSLSSGGEDPKSLFQIIADLDGFVTANKFNSPFTQIGGRSFSFYEDLLGLDNSSIADLRKFQAWLESHIVQRMEELPEIQDFANTFAEEDFGPAIVINFRTEVSGNNFFGEPFTNNKFLVVSNSNIKIRNIAVVADGLDFSAVIGREGFFRTFLMPIGDSVLREADGTPRPWGVVDQYLPFPRNVSLNPGPSYVPWEKTAWQTLDDSKRYLTTIKKFPPLEARISTFGDPPNLESKLAGRAAWNNHWLLVIPGAQWSPSFGSQEQDQQNLINFIYGPTGDPDDLIGITDIRLRIEAYQN